MNSVARVTEITARSEKSFEDALKVGIGRATKTLRGVPSVAKLSERFPIKFYLVAMLFILFDVDAAFLYPWALVFKELGMFGFVEMMVFMGMLGAGFAYAWKSGALEW